MALPSSTQARTDFFSFCSPSRRFRRVKPTNQTATGSLPPCFATLNLALTLETARLTISDGDYKHPSAMVATQLNELLTSEKIKANSFIKVTKFLCNNVSDRRIIIMLGIEVVQTDVDGPIGTLPP